MEYQVSAEEVKWHLDKPMAQLPAGMLGLGAGMREGLANASSPAPMLDQICERIAGRNGQLREIIERLESAMDRMQPVGVNRATDNEAPEASGIIGRIEAAVDCQGELLVRLRCVASHLETIA